MDITLISVTTRNVNAHAAALAKTKNCIPHPTKSIIISPTKPKKFDGLWYSLPYLMPNNQWNFPSDLNRFLVKDLVNHIDTKVCFTVHDDGYALNPKLWTDEFLEYDYIGAPWPADWHKHRVGNGGFSLRSKKWLELCSKLPVPTKSEDVYCCVENYDYFTKHGCKVAPFELALRFSCECGLADKPGWNTKQSFGFHGRAYKRYRKHVLKEEGIIKKSLTVLKNLLQSGIGKA